MTVVETSFFLRQAAGLLTDKEREQLIAFVASNPETGDVVPESGGERNELKALTPRIVENYRKSRQE